MMVTSPEEERFKVLAKEPNVDELGMPIWDEVELRRLLGITIFLSPGIRLDGIL